MTATATPQTRPRLVAIDLDGTLIGKALRLSPAVVEAVKQVTAAGIHVAIVTGRMFQAARPFAAALGLRDEIVCYQGAAIYDLSSGERIRHEPVGRAVAERAVARAKSDGVHTQLYVDDQLYVDALNHFTKIYTDLARVEPVLVPSLEDVLEREESTKIVFVMDAAKVPEYIATVRAVCGADGYVTRSEPEFVEVLNPAVDKGKALAFLAAHHGVTLEETFAIGDSWNDLPLLKASGFSVAMGSAPPEVQAAADAVVADQAHDGVREALERFVLA